MTTYVLRKPQHVIFLMIVLTGLACLAFSDTTTAPVTWMMMGNGIDNSRAQPLERLISASNVQSLRPNWMFQTSGGNVTATPTVFDNAIYFPDWSGHLTALNQSDGSVIWSKLISGYDGFPGSVSRVSPAIHGSDLIIGDTESAKKAHNGANVMAIDRTTGKLRWITNVDRHPAAVITGSPVVFEDMILVGVSSLEESLATNATYPCCTFRGSLVALDAISGDIIWQTYTVPDNHSAPNEYSGGAIWQPPAIDPARGSVFIGTGNNYEVPDSAKACLNTGGNNCFASNNYIDSALALDLQTGKVKWSHMLQGIDIWTVACVEDPNPTSCPVPSSPDYDLGGSGPNLLPNMVGFGQKSGTYWALNPDTGAVLWSTMVGPGATLGGIEWGTASDGQRIYVAISNGKNKPYPLIDGSTTTGGAWTALEASSGKILWQTADPVQGYAIGAVSVANGVMYAGSYSGNMHALDAQTGKILWTMDSGGSVIDGPSIVNGVVYWGSGYSNLASPPGIPNNRVFALSLPGRF